MRCDYYTWRETFIDYTDISGTIRTLVSIEDRTYWNKHYYTYPDCNSDFEIPRPERTLRDDIAHYGTRLLFENNTWYCSESGIYDVEEICNANAILCKSILRVYKRLGGFER